MRAETARELQAAGLDPKGMAEFIDRSLDEDLRDGIDVTSAATVPEGQHLTVNVVMREPGVVAGMPVLAAVMDIVSASAAEVELRARDGDRSEKCTSIATISALARQVLLAERLSLNLLSRLCGTATLTRHWADAIAHTRAQVRDTRKTTPGLRDLEKYAVRCGGGVNHRRGLDDAFLIKDNHLLAAGGVTQALDGVVAWRRQHGRPDLVVQLEVDDLDQLAEALKHDLFVDSGAEPAKRQILCDNFAGDDLRRAVSMRDAQAPGVLLEASGGLTLDAAAATAETGVDYISVGGLTHSAAIIDIAFDG